MDLLSFLLPVAHAQIGAPPNVGLPTTPLPQLILQIVNYALILVGVCALAYMVYGGFLYITSGGDDKRVEQGKEMIVYAVIGIIVIGAAAALVNFAVGAVLQGS